MSRAPYVLLAAALAAVPAARACEPCANELGLTPSVEAAAAIIVAVSPEKPGEPDLDGTGGPDVYEVGVERVLKGKLEGKTATVVGWQGSCSYGFVDWKHKRQVLLLANPHLKTTIWRPVADGCAVKALEMRGDDVIIEGKPLALAKFIKRFKLSASPIPPPNTR